jgi:DNA polymerase III subunit alpha
MSKILHGYYVDDPLFDPSVIDEEHDNFEMHIHTKYSSKDALSDPDEYCKRAKELGYTTVTATEHGVLYSAVEMAQAAKKYGLKFIPGCEVYETDNRMHHARAGQEVYHFLLLAANDQGYKDLMTIVSDASTIGKFDDNERTDFNFIEANGLGKNLIATSACLGGRISQLILAGEKEEAKKVAKRLKKMFYAFYFELQDNEIKDQGIVNMELIEMSKELGIPVVLTSDIHYVYPEDGEHHDTLICIGFNNKKNDPNRYRYEGDFPYYLRSPKDKYDWAKKNNIPIQAIYNTKLIADHCDVHIPMGLDLLPEFPCPTGFDPASFMERLCYDSLQEYLQKQTAKGHYMNVQEYIDRLNMEVKVIRDKNYPGYFLTLWDFVQFLKRENIFLGPGRGSAAGSLIAYLLGITKLDPIIYDLQFERFLNPERNSMPDIDIDIPDIHRSKCIDYIKNKYGSENVAQIMTFGEIGVKSGIRDLVRVLELDPAIANEISELVPAKMPDQSDVTLDVLMELADEGSKTAEKFGERGGIVEIAKRFKGYMEEYPDIYDALRKVEGTVRSKGIHAGGVIICKDKISNYAPVEKGSGTAVLDICAFPMGTVEEIGLLKMDFLGLRTLSVVAMALDAIEQRTGKYIDLYDIGRDDKEVFQLLRDGHTHAIFQVSGNGITHYMKQVKPTTFDHVIDVLALFRPGPLEAEVAPGVTMCDRYVENGDIHPEDYMEDTDERIRHVMEKTRAVLIYQEQIMTLVREMAGYTLGAADSFRRVIGKKKIKEVAAIRWQFLYGKHAADKIKDEMANIVNEEQKKELEDQLYIVEKSPVTAEGAIAKGWSLKDADYWFKAIGKFAGYGFNRSHSAAYADLTYQTAWLKVHYPVEFMMAQLTSQADNQDKTIANLNECRRMGIKILSPDVHKSQKGYTIDEWEDEDGNKHPAIRCGLLSIKGVGPGVIEEIKGQLTVLDEHGQELHAPYRNFDDFISRVSGKTVNKNYVEKLILAGCFDEMEPNRFKLLNHYFFNIRGDKQYGGTPEEYREAKAQKDKAKKPKSNEYPVHDPTTFTQELQLEYEKEFIGVFLSGHPLGDLPYKPWSSLQDGEDVKIGGRIKTVRKHKTKGKGDLMAFIKLETQAEELDVTVFPRDYKNLEEKIFKGNIVVVKGKKQVKDGREGILVDNIIVPKKKKHKVERDLQADPLEFTPKVKGQKKQQQLFENEDLPPLTPKADPLAALFGE